MSTLTQGIGTPIYMSPERLQSKDYGLPADMWAIGLIFYQMVSGYLPFDMQFHRIIMDKPKSLPSFVPESV
jgi:serine/threonine protein kinase